MVTCPGCRQPLHGEPRCAACGLRLVGPEATELWQLDQQLAALVARRGQLLAALHGAPTAPSRPLPTESTRWSAQRILLGLGVLLVVVAGLVFVAVSWKALGVAGQVGVVAALAGTGGVISRLLERRELTASAEAAALLGLGMLVVGAVAAHGLGLAGLAAVDPFRYAAGVALLLALVAGAMTGVSSLRSWPVVTVVAAAAVGPMWWGFETLPLAITLAVGTAGSAALGVLPGRWSGLRTPARIAGPSCAAATSLIGLFAVYADDPQGLPATGVAAAVAIGVAAVTRRPEFRNAAAAVLGLQVSAAAFTGPPAVGAAVVVVAAAAVAVLGFRVDSRWAVIGGLAATVVVPVSTLALLTGLQRETTWTLRADAAWVSVLVATGAGGLAALAPALRRRLPVVAAYAALSLLAGAAIAAAAASPTALVVTLAVGASVLVGWAAATRDEVETLLLVVAGLAGASALGLALAAYASLVPAGFVLSGVGVVITAYGFRPGRSAPWWLGAVATPAGIWLWLFDADVRTVEAYSLPIATAALITGVFGWYRHRGDASSWVVAGPALAAGLLPSAVASTLDDSLLRPLLVLAVATAVLLVGVRRHRQAPVVIASAALLVVAVSQLGPHVIAAPRWLTLGTAGALLLAAGVRYEARRRNLVDASRWLRALR